MYATHQPIIAEFARKSPENLYRTLQFVQATINQRFYMVPTIIMDLHQGIEHNKYLTRHQKFALEYYWRERESIYNTLLQHEGVTELQHRFLVSLPGFGIPKAGFILQLVYGVSGCMDTHNLRVYGLNARQFQACGASAELLEKRIHTYNTLVQSIGTESLWDSWCTLIADKYPSRFIDAEQVSKLHVDCIVTA